MKINMLTLFVSVFSIIVPNQIWASTELLKDLICREGKTSVVDFHPGTLPFPDGTNLTDEFEKQGIIFSDDDSDLPPFFQQSLGAQENRIQQGTFFNLFRLNFSKAVVRVSVRFGDQRGGDAQVHILQAFDADGNDVDQVFFSEARVGGGVFPDVFTLTVSSCKGIAFIVALEQPLGAQRMDRISFTELKKH